MKKVDTFDAEGIPVCVVTYSSGLTENSDEKTYQLIALAASAGMKCEYCIVAHTALAKGAGATDEEIKTVAMMAGIVAINSTMLYTNQYDMDELKKMFSK